MKAGNTPFSLVAVFSFLLIAASLLAGDAAPPRYDVLIVGGRLVDGTGNPWTTADLGVRADRVVARGRLAGAPARRVIDATGLVVAPGFIDMLGQSEFTLLVDPRAESKVRQGVTTEITGEGSSAAPQNPGAVPRPGPFGGQIDWYDFAGYFARLERQGIAINFGSYVGATQVRRVVMGSENRAPTGDELAEMERLVEEAMRQGAQGLSTSLIYAPANYARTDELVALARVASAHGGIYATHMRSEGRGIFRALEETFTIARQAHIPVEIFHLKAAGQNLWGRMGEVIARIKAARAAGLGIAADQYPYVASATALRACIPPWAHAGGREDLLNRLRDPATRARLRRELSQPDGNWENLYWMAGGAEGVLISSVRNPDLNPYVRKRLAEIARERGEDPRETLFELLLADQAETSAIYFLMSEEDVKLALQQPWVSVGIDSAAVATDGPLRDSKPHPRAYGTFPRILGRYVREQQLLSLEEAIRKMTSLPAQRLGLVGRGLLLPGFYADIVIFDFERIRDHASFEESRHYSQGVEYVLVNGELVLDQGRRTGALPGHVLRGPGWKSSAAPQSAAVAVAAAVRGQARVVDLSYSISDKLPAWPGDTRTFEARVNRRAEEAGYFSRSFWMLEHFGTHLDAPIHFAPGTTSVDEVPPERLFGPAVVLEVRRQVAADPDYRVQAEDVQEWEQRHGRIPSGAIVLARTGWAERWPDEQRYRNQDEEEVMHFPGFSVAAVEILIERGVVGLGIDTFSVDYGASKDFEVHRLAHRAGLYHLENLADLSSLPESGALLIVAPIKLEGGSGGPVRILAVLP